MISCSMTFDQHEAELFLAEPHVGVFAVETPDGPPAAVPLWYAYTPGSDLSIMTSASTRKAKLLATSRRATLVAQTVATRTRYVSIELALLDTHPATVEEARAIAGRYLPESALEDFLRFATETLREDLYRFAITRWRFGDFTI